MAEIIIPSSDDIVTINRKLGGAILNPGSIDFLITRIESKTQKKDYKRQVATVSAIFWYELIQSHPFVDGNKRTATETMKLFLKQNNLKLDTPISGLVYISLKIANNEISYPELIEWIYRRLEDGNV
ncbi:type II toxin-antitoxin system death-on-curing family toxin [ANME-2 cluster archaeon]|nr:Fic family protein [Methanosarcinales archaeon]RJS72155.1 MAG: type II toxin-antitoxin system death-on-curing family toxin [ANME-2 cluster archaeon]